MTKTEYLIRELRSRLWVKPSVMGIAAVLWVSGAYAFSKLLPERHLADIDAKALINLLGIMASTMLTVATFSVTAMVSAFSAVSTTATPRATRIMMQDRSTQNSLTAFLAAFIYSIVALVAISTAPQYGIGGRFLLFVGYVVMIIWVLVSFVKWVDRVSKLGRMGDTLERVEESCREAFESSDTMGTLGARQSGGDSPDGPHVTSDIIGYVQNIDVAALDEIASELKTTIRILERPGAFVDPADPLAIVVEQGDLDEKNCGKIKECFQIGDQRRVNSDPRFALIMLSEIADRALSPAVNDPGTAIAVIGIQGRLMENWRKHRSDDNEVKYENIEVDPLDPEDLLDDAFTAISRDGAAFYEVGTRIQKSLAILARDECLTKAAHRHSELALEQAMNALPTEYHKKLIKSLSESVVGKKS